MSVTTTKTPSTGLHPNLPAAVFNRILDEGYGPGAWYGSDLRAALADVPPAAAYRRPAPGRHNIAEIALHHAYWLGQVESKLTGAPAASFPVEGEDWFELDDESRVSWSSTLALVDAAQQRLSRAAVETASGARVSPLSEAERFDFVIGITGHAAYHAGQIQLIKKLI